VVGVTTCATVEGGSCREGKKPGEKNCLLILGRIDRIAGIFPYLVVIGSIESLHLIHAILYDGMENNKHVGISKGEECSKI
jgi:hypothetical protein